MSDNTEAPPSRYNGQYHSVKGTVVETVGDLIGSQSWRQSGQQEHAAGEAEMTAAQAKDYADGAADRVGGKIDAVTGAITGDTEQQMSGNLKHDKGKAEMEFNKPTSS